MFVAAALWLHAPVAEDLRSVAIGQLIADPRLSIERTLALLINQSGASCGALVLIRGGGEAVLGVGRDLDAAGVERALSMAVAGAALLSGGRPWFAANACLWPVEGTCGAIYLASPNGLAPAAIIKPMAAVADLLRVAVEVFDVRRSDVSLIEDYLAGAKPAELERRQLLTILERSEWNLARAARIMGVTRATIYNRMERLGIERVKVPKTLRPRTV